MKKIILLNAFLFFFLSVSGQKVPVDKVPAPVKSAFKSKFPGVTKVSWQIATGNEYKALFAWKKAARTAYFGGDGSWRQTETMIKSAAVPQNIRSSIPKLYPGYKIKTAYKVEKREGAATYKVIIFKGTKIMNLTYAITGELLKKGMEN